jgi:hypothetical protein
MLLGFLTVVIMLAVGYAYLREGVFTACTMFVNTLIAGLVAFNFWEPIADMLDPNFADYFLHGYEDCIVLVALFAVTLGILRMITNAICRTEMEYPQWLRRGGGFLFGMATGYIVCGFLLCVLQTLPWHEEFMFFPSPSKMAAEPRKGLSRVLPPDLVWLAMMNRAGAYTFANNQDENPLAEASDFKPYYKEYATFDKYGTFELRYARYRRRNPDTRGGSADAVDYLGEFDQQLNKGG